MRLVNLPKGYRLYTLMPVEYHTVHSKLESKRKKDSLHVEQNTNLGSNSPAPITIIDLIVDLAKFEKGKADEVVTRY